jgi:hypothetical protein
MGTASVAMGTVYERLNLKQAEQGNRNASWWAQALVEALVDNEDSPRVGGQHLTMLEPWTKIGMRQLSGMFVIVFARLAAAQHLTNVFADAVGCGVGGFGGNKGAVALSMCIHRQRVLLLTSHFAAHQVRAPPQATTSPIRPCMIAWHGLGCSLRATDLRRSCSLLVAGCVCAWKCAAVASTPLCRVFISELSSHVYWTDLPLDERAARVCL